MLSHIVSLVNNYEQDHGSRPNLIYMNEMHYAFLREEVPYANDHYDVVNIIGIDIALSDEAVHPHVATVRFSESEHILNS